MENKSFNFDLQLFTTYTLKQESDGRYSLVNGLASDTTTANLATLMAGVTNTDVVEITSKIKLGSGTLDFHGATVNVRLGSSKDYGLAAYSDVTVANGTINLVSGGADASVIGHEYVGTESDDSTTITLKNLKMSTSVAETNVIAQNTAGKDMSTTYVVQSCELSSTGTGSGVIWLGDTYGTNKGYVSMTLDSNTVVSSSSSADERLIAAGVGASNGVASNVTVDVVSNGATFVNESSADSGGKEPFVVGSVASSIELNGGSFTNTKAKDKVVSSSDLTISKATTFTLQKDSVFNTENATYKVKEVDGASSSASLTLVASGVTETASSTTGIFEVTAVVRTVLNDYSIAAGKTAYLGGEDWYSSSEYGSGLGSSYTNGTFYFTSLPKEVTSGDTPNIQVKDSTGKVLTNATVTGAAASDATVTFTNTAVKSGEVQIVALNGAKVTKIVNGSETLEAGSFEIGEGGTLIFGADLSSEESSDDTSGETSDDTSGETSDDTSGETSDESGETSDESGETSDESGETSDESGDTSDESGDTSDESGDTSDESGETSDESGETSDESGETSDESGETSDESGDTSDESGDTSDESGDTSDESGDTSDESGETSDESGETSDDSSSDTSDETSGDDTTDDADEAESFIKDLADGEVHDMTDQSSVTLGKGDLASVPSDATGTKTINMGDDAAYVSIAKGAKAKVNINLGAGDNFVSNGGTNTAIDFSNALKTKVALGEGSHADFNSYDWKSGAGVATSAEASGLTSFYEALASKLVSLLSAFTLSSPASSTASSDVLDDLATGTDTNDADAKSAYVNLYYGESYNKNVVMGMTGSGDSYINTNENDTLRDEPIVLVGNYTNNVSGTASLISGSGNDGVFAGDGDTVDAGTGTNKIYLNTTGTSAKGTTIMMTSGDNFVTGMDNNDGIITEAGVDAVTAENGNMVFRNDDGGITTIVNGADGVSAYNVRAAGVDYSAVAGTSRVAYNGVSNYYNASNQNASITASTSSAEIWLNKDVARSYGYTSEFIGDIKYVNASGVSGRTTLAGAADIDNVITAGSGAASLWGGGSSDDTLVAGKGSNTFFYMKGDGNDSIRGADDYDTVRIEGGMTLADITKIDVSNAAVALEFSDGGSLTLNSNNGTKFKIDGATYTYDKSAGDWQKS